MRGPRKGCILALADRTRLAYIALKWQYPYSKTGKILFKFCFIKAYDLFKFFR